MLRAALLDRDKWKQHEADGTLVSWIAELAFWRSGFAGPLDPLVQAVRGMKYRRDISGTVAGPQFGSLLQNVQDIIGVFTNNTPGTNTQERKAAKALYNLTLGPLVTYGAAAAPGGSVTGPLLGAAATVGGSGSVQDSFATLLAGPAFDPATQKRVKHADGSTTVQPKSASDVQHAAELKRERERQARLKAMRAAANANR